MTSNAVNGGISMSSAGKRLMGTYTPAEDLLRDINVKVNQTTIVNHLDFLREVDSNHQLTEGAILSRALERYERYWLPLVAKHTQEAIAAPVDIEWVWHCHMLSPVNYETDCLTLVGKVIPHKLMNAEDRKKSLNKGQEIWNKEYPNVPFGADLVCQNGDIGEPFVAKMHYDILQASARQKVFYYNVSLPHYRDAKFLETSLERYQKFLYLLKTNPDSFLAPTYDIDLLWHTHQLDPLAYKEDMLNIIGKHLNHDDTTNDRSEGSKLTSADKLIRKLWKKQFNENFARPGAMYRGDSSRGKLHNLSEEEVNDVLKSVQGGEINITELQLDGLPTNVRIAKLELISHKILLNRVHTDKELFHSRKWFDETKKLWKDPNLFTGRVNIKACQFIDFQDTSCSRKGFSWVQEHWIAFPYFIN